MEKGNLLILLKHLCKTLFTLNFQVTIQSEKRLVQEERTPRARERSWDKQTVLLTLVLLWVSYPQWSVLLSQVRKNH